MVKVITKPVELKHCNLNKGVLLHQPHNPNIMCETVVEHEQLFGRHENNCRWAGHIKHTVCGCVLL